jgi:hypothetical protein
MPICIGGGFPIVLAHRRKIVRTTVGIETLIEPSLTFDTASSSFDESVNEMDKQDPAPRSHVHDMGDYRVVTEAHESRPFLAGRGAPIAGNSTPFATLPLLFRRSRMIPML